MTSMTQQVHELSPSVLGDPLRNRGTAFSAEQRRRLGLTGRLPSAVETLDEQTARCYEELGRKASAIEKYMSELLQGVVRSATREGLGAIARRMAREDGAEAVILGGTELSLILKDEWIDGMPVLDTTAIA